MNQCYFARWGSMLVALLIAALLPVGLSAVRAQTATEIIVDSTADQVDADLVDDICDADPGPAVQCTLRAAVMQTNVTPGTFMIRLQAQRYPLTIPGAGENQSATGDLDIRGEVEVIGATAGSARTIIDASAINDRVLDIASQSAVLRNLVITGGNLPSTTELGSDFNGGGIRAGGTLLISDSVVRNNTAARGGGIASGARLTVERTTIRNNSATALDTGSVVDGGGGIVTNGRTIVRDSVIQNNTSAFQGGGISSVPGSFGLSTQIERSLIVGNSAQGRGGGILIEGINDGDFVLNNSTVSANRSASAGGGIAAQNQTVPAVLTASTIAGNSAPFAGGVLIDEITANNVIFSNNTLLNCILSPLAKGASNLSTDHTCVFLDDFNPNLVNVSARLGPLAFNGGPTRTHALLEGSPAIDAGTFPSFAILFDQRGGLRIPPGRLPAPFGNPHDIGAFEFNAAGVGTFTLTPATVTVTAEQPTTLTLTWTHPTRWRDLNHIDLQLRHEEQMPLWVRFTEGFTETAGISTTNGLALYNSDGTLAGVGMPGENELLESDSAVLDLAQSRVEGSSPDGQEVMLTLAVQLKQAAANQVYTATLLASSDDGMLQGPSDAGTAAVGPFRTLLPLIAQS
jgi:hypothetical protein